MNNPTQPEWLEMPWHILRPVQLELFPLTFWQQMGLWMLGEGPDPR